MKKKSSLAKELTTFLTVMLCGILLNFIIVLYSKIKSNTIMNNKFIVFISFQVIFMAICIYMIYELRYIIGNIAKGNVFCNINANKFNIIGKCMLTIGILDTIANIHSNINGTVLISIFGWVIKPTILIYIILASLAFILSQIFEDAIRIKKENDLTI